MSFTISTDNGSADSVDIIFDDGSTGRAVGVNYGPDASYGQAAAASLFSGTAYKATLSITGMAVVHFQCFVNSDLSGDQTYNTPQAPVVNVVGATVVVTWNSSSSGLGTLTFTLAGGSPMSQPDDNEASTTAHLVTLDDLVGGSQYSCAGSTQLDSGGSEVTPTVSFQAPSTMPVDPPGHVAASANPSRVPVGGSVTVTVQVLQKGGSAQADVPVAFSMGNGKADLSPATATGSTGSNGQVTAQFSVTDIPAGQKRAHRFVVAMVGDPSGKQKRRRALVIGLSNS